MVSCGTTHRLFAAYLRQPLFPPVSGKQRDMAEPQLPTAQQQESYHVLTWHHSFWHILFFFPTLPLSVAALMHLQNMLVFLAAGAAPIWGRTALKELHDCTGG